MKCKTWKRCWGTLHRWTGPLTCSRWDVYEFSAAGLGGMIQGKTSPPREILWFQSSLRCSPWHSVDPSHHITHYPSSPGPFIHVHLAEPPALSQIAGVVGAVDQTGRKEFAAILEGG